MPLNLPDCSECYERANKKCDNRPTVYRASRFFLPELYLFYDIFPISELSVVKRCEFGIDFSEIFIAFQPVAAFIFSDYEVRFKILIELDPTLSLGERRVI